jgi:hypothetical protein
MVGERRREYAFEAPVTANLMHDPRLKRSLSRRMLEIEEPMAVGGDMFCQSSCGEVVKERYAVRDSLAATA